MNRFLDVVVTAFAFWSLIGIILFMGVVLQSLQEEDVAIAKRHNDKVVVRNIGV